LELEKRLRKKEEADAVAEIKRRDSQEITNTELERRTPTVNFLIEIEECQLREELGKGSYGIVYKGRWRGCEVAVKQLQATDHQQLLDFQEEAKKLKLLRPHPYVVQFLGATSPSKDMCIFTELVEGGSLIDKLEDIGFTLQPEITCKIINGISAGMLHLHTEGIVHRDLAARNILLTGAYQVKIADFGYARVLQSNEDQKTTRQNLGPIRWMAPEAMIGKQGKWTYSQACDVWMFGVVLYEIFYRELPYNDKTFPEVIDGKCHSKDLLLPYPTDVPIIADVMSKCLQYDPLQRPSFSEICKQFELLKPEQLTTVPPYGISERIPVCVLRILPQFVINYSNPIICRVIVEEGAAAVETNLFIPSRNFIEIGKIVAIYTQDLKEIQQASKGEEVTVKIQQSKGQRYVYDKHFEHTNKLYSKIPRNTLYIYNSLVKTWQTERSKDLKDPVIKG